MKEPVEIFIASVVLVVCALVAIKSSFGVKRPNSDRVGSLGLPPGYNLLTDGEGNYRVETATGYTLIDTFTSKEAANKRAWKYYEFFSEQKALDEKGWTRVEDSQ